MKIGLIDVDGHSGFPNLALYAMGVMPFAQPYRDYDGGDPTAEQKKFARWVNARQAFRACRYEEFTG